MNVKKNWNGYQTFSYKAILNKGLQIFEISMVVLDMLEVVVEL